MDNMYRAPQSSLGRSVSQGVSPFLAEILASGSLWARFTSIFNFISLFFVIIYLLMLLFGVGVGAHASKANIVGIVGVGIGVTLLVLPSILIYWFFASSMNRYAKAAKQLRSGEASEEDVAQCFASSSTFLKTFGLCFIFGLVVMILGIVAALALPAYQDYIMRARMR